MTHKHIPEHCSLEKRRTAAGGAASALVTAIVFAVSMAFNQRYPLGHESRAISDLGAQFIPFHALWSDILTARAFGDLLFTWNLGMGQGFLADYATYVASPVALLVGFFPRTQIETALFVVTVVKLALAGGAMTLYLRVLRPSGSLVWATALGVAYGTCSWALDDGAWMPMWLDGFWGLPLLGIVSEWARQRRRPVIGTLLVALVWWSNYYTAYMASIATALFLIARVIAEGDRVREALGTIVAFLWRGILGVAITATILLPTFWSVLAAQPAPAGTLSPKPWAFLVARLFPLTEGSLGSPGIGVGSLTLILAFSLPFAVREGWRRRITYPVLLVALFASLKIPVTQLAWHAFDVPNGGAFRESFVVCALLVLMAWHTTADGLPGWRVVAGGTLVSLLAASYVMLRPTGRETLSSGSVLVFVAVALGVLAAGSANKHWPRTTTTTLTAVLIIEATANAIYIDTQRSKSEFFTYPAWTSASAKAYAVAMRDATANWPITRAISDPELRANAGGLAQLPGLSYYSSSVSRNTADTAAHLGMPWTSYGRGLAETVDPGLRPLLAIGAIVRTDEAIPSVAHVPAMPMVRVLPTGDSGESTPFAARNDLAGALVATQPEVRIADSNDVLSGPMHVMGGQRLVLETQCPIGTLVQAYAPEFSGEVALAGAPAVRQTASTEADALATRAGVVSLGRSAGRAQVAFTADGPGTLVPNPLACLDTAALDAAVAQAAGPAQLAIQGSQVKASWATPQHGDAVIATPNDGAWRCRVDGRLVPTRPRSGLLAVDMAGGTELTCSFVPRGLMLGFLTSITALGVLAGVSVVRRSQQVALKRPQMDAAQR